MRAEAGELGYTLVTWSIDPRDWSRPGAAAIAQRVIGRAFPGGVVVMHDGVIVEAGTVDQVLHAPRHPYTAGLVAAARLDLVEPGTRLPTVEDGGWTP